MTSDAQQDEFQKMVERQHGQVEEAKESVSRIEFEGSLNVKGHPRLVIRRLVSGRDTRVVILYEPREIQGGMTPQEVADLIRLMAFAAGLAQSDG